MHICDVTDLEGRGLQAARDVLSRMANLDETTRLLSVRDRMGEKSDDYMQALDRAVKGMTAAIRVELSTNLDLRDWLGLAEVSGTEGEAYNALKALLFSYPNEIILEDLPDESVWIVDRSLPP